jgi:transcriptional regulator with XRE-family HTH domain
MVKETSNCTVSRLLLGRQLRQLRERKGIRTEVAAAEAGVARATLWRMEKGGNRCRYKPGDLTVLGRLYGADRKTLDLLGRLSEGTRVRSWIGAYRDVVSDRLETYLGMEGYASRVRSYPGALVPELLQTEDYAKVLLSGGRDLSITQIRKHVQVRMNRQSVMVRRLTGVAYEFVLDEAVLHRTIGGPAVMAGQLRRILDLGARPNVSVRVVPYGAGSHRGLRSGAFGVLSFPVDRGFGGLPTTVCLDGVDEGPFLDKARDVETYEEDWRDVDSRALGEGASGALVEEILRKLDRH